MKRLKRIFHRLDDVMTASAFAEAGEVETARTIIKEADGTDGLRQRMHCRKSMVLKPNHS